MDCEYCADRIKHTPMRFAGMTLCLACYEAEIAAQAEREEP